MKIVGRLFKSCVLLCPLLIFNVALSQEHPPETEVSFAPDGRSTHHYKNIFSAYTGTTIAPTVVKPGHNSEFIFVPTYAIEYARFVRPWLGLGIDNEIELQHYVIQEENGESLKRDFIYKSSIIVIIHPVNHFAVYFGPGLELTSSHNFSVLKLGFEYVMYRGDGHGWYIAPEISIDWVSNLYATYNFGISLGKGF